MIYESAVLVGAAVAAVPIPHLIGTAIRFRHLRARVDRVVLWRFGLMSAAGGLGGALLATAGASPARWRVH